MKFLKCLYLALVKSQSEKDGYKGNFRGLDIYKYIQRSNAVYEVRLKLYKKYTGSIISWLLVANFKLIRDFYHALSNANHIDHKIISCFLLVRASYN